MDKMIISGSNDGPEKKVEAEKVKKEEKKKEPMSRQDMLCYMGAFIFFILAFLPIIMRNIDPNYGMQSKKENNDTPAQVKTSRLLCNKNFDEEGYSYYADIASSYSNDNVMITNITYKVTIDPGFTLTFEDVEIPEYKTMGDIESDAIVLGVEDNTYTVRIDYSLDTTLRNNDLLNNHNKVLNVQRGNYEENGYSCVVE